MPCTQAQILFFFLMLAGSGTLPAQTHTWGEAGEWTRTYHLGEMETDTGKVNLYLEYRTKKQENPGQNPLQLIFLKRQPQPLAQAIEVNGNSQPHGTAARGAGLSPALIDSLYPVTQVLFQGRKGVPRFSAPENDHPWNISLDAESRLLSFRWEDHLGYYAEWAWDDSLLIFLPNGFTSYQIPWSADSSARLHRRSFQDVPVRLLAKVHGIGAASPAAIPFPDDWTASGQCMVRTRIWDDFRHDELHGHFSIRYTSGRIAPKKSAGEAMTVEVEGTWMEGNIPFGPMRLEAWFDDGTVVRAMLNYAPWDDLKHATGRALWANISCIVQEKGGPKSYSLHLSEVRAPSLPMLLRELRRSQGVAIPSLFVPERPLN